MSHLFTRGNAKDCAQALKTADGRIMLTMWLNNGARVRKGIASDLAKAESAAGVFLKPPLSVNADGIKIQPPPSEETQDAACAMSEQV